LLVERGASHTSAMFLEAIEAIQLNSIAAESDCNTVVSRLLASVLHLLSEH